MLPAVVYGGIGIFLGPLMGLFVRSAYWEAALIAQVLVTTSAFFCLSHALAYAFGHKWVAIPLTVLFAAVFFWRPVMALGEGPMEVRGRIESATRIDIYILRASNAVDHNVQYDVVIGGNDGSHATVRVSGSRYEELMGMEAACAGDGRFVVLRPVRTLLSAECVSEAEDPI